MMARNNVAGSEKEISGEHQEKRLVSREFSHRASEPLQERVAQAVADIPEIQLVYLFGSQVTGNIGPLSDYDFGVLLDSPAAWPQLRAELGRRLAQALDMRRIDLVPLNRAPIELAFAVIAEGELLFERDVATRVEYEARIMSLYGDYLPVLRQQRRDILEDKGYDTRVQRYRAALGRTERTLREIRAAQGEDAG
jgi:predicted nucleotidyltransferase